MIGATYKLTPNLTLYGDFAEANRAPTPLEFACSDPFRPCLIDNSLVGDPDLRQVVSYTFEAGLRGQFGIAKGLLNWTVGDAPIIPTTSSPSLPGFPIWFENRAQDLLILGIVCVCAVWRNKERSNFETRIPHVNIHDINAFDIWNVPRKQVVRVAPCKNLRRGHSGRMVL